MQNHRLLRRQDPSLSAKRETGPVSEPDRGDDLRYCAAGRYHGNDSIRKTAGLYLRLVPFPVWKFQVPAESVSGYGTLRIGYVCRMFLVNNSGSDRWNGIISKAKKAAARNIQLKKDDMQKSRCRIIGCGIFDNIMRPERFAVR